MEQPRPDGGTLYDKVRTLTSKPLKLVVGHAHGDHSAQAQNFLNAGVPVYANQRSWNGLAAVLATRDNIKQVNNIEEGDQFDSGPPRYRSSSTSGHRPGTRTPW